MFLRFQAFQESFKSHSRELQEPRQPQDSPRWGQDRLKTAPRQAKDRPNIAKSKPVETPLRGLLKDSRPTIPITPKSNPRALFKFSLHVLQRNLLSTMLTTCVHEMFPHECHILRRFNDTPIVHRHRKVFNTALQ